MGKTGITTLLICIHIMFCGAQNIRNEVEQQRQQQEVLNKPAPPQKGDVYVVGNIQYDMGGYVATLWKNGIVQKLGAGEANSVFVSGSDVYVAGSYASEPGVHSMAILWKNGIAQNLSEGTSWAEANSICVSGSDVYVAGSVRNVQGNVVATIWKNGVAQKLADGSAYPAGYFFVSENDVYVVETEFKVFEESVFVLWKNGVKQNQWTGTPNYFYVSGNDVYVAGYKKVEAQDEDDISDLAVLWINGVMQNAELFRTNSMFVAGNDIFVAGISVSYDSKRESFINVPTLLKNGVKQLLSDIVSQSNFESARANAIFVVD